MFSLSLSSWHPVIIFVQLDGEINHSSPCTPLSPPHRRANGSDGGLTGQQRHLQFRGTKPGVRAAWECSHSEGSSSERRVKNARDREIWTFSLSAASTMWVASGIVVLTFLRLLRGAEEIL